MSNASSILFKKKLQIFWGNLLSCALVCAAFGIPLALLSGGVLDLQIDWTALGVAGTAIFVLAGVVSLQQISLKTDERQRQMEAH